VYPLGINLMHRNVTVKVPHPRPMSLHTPLTLAPYPLVSWTLVYTTQHTILTHFSPTFILNRGTLDSSHSPFHIFQNFTCIFIIFYFLQTSKDNPLLMHVLYTLSSLHTPVFHQISSCLTLLSR